MYRAKAVLTAILALAAMPWSCRGRGNEQSTPDAALSDADVAALNVACKRQAEQGYCADYSDSSGTPHGTLLELSIGGGPRRLASEPVSRGVVVDRLGTVWRVSDVEAVRGGKVETVRTAVRRGNVLPQTRAVIQRLTNEMTGKLVQHPQRRCYDCSTTVAVLTQSNGQKLVLFRESPGGLDACESPAAQALTAFTHNLQASVM